MKSLFIVLFLANLSNVVLAQNADYFQQQVNYDMLALLIPEQGSVVVEGTFTYHNNSPKTLDSLPIHLWANAFSDRNSAYAQQKRKFREIDFLYAPEADLGGYQDLKFTAGIAGAPRFETPELAWIQLATPVRSGDSTLVSFAYTLKVPKAFSRLGKIGDHYQLTQWYPKPALLDTDGWHTMPYLDYGEYFNDFGNYRVSITVPKNGVVAATGDLVNDAGIAARQDRIEQSKIAEATFDSLEYDQAPNKTTFTYVADNVTDFAWFASPHYRITVDTAYTGKTAIPTFAYYNEKESKLWSHAAQLLARSVSYGSRLVGAYPHNSMTAVSAPIGVGGGMEYPGITVINAVSDTASLDLVLAHEAYHNWFQGHLSSNERDHAWQDEGLTSWLESKYAAAYGVNRQIIASSLPALFTSKSNYSDNGLLTKLLGTAKRNPAPNTPIDQLHTIHYGYAAYALPDLLFNMHEQALGDSVFVDRIRAYYQEWGGRHPSTGALETAIAADEPWLFQLIDSAALPDYAIQNAVVGEQSISLTIENKSSIVSPIPIAFEFESGGYSPVQWVPGFSESNTIELPKPQETIRVGIDPLAQTPEVNRNDNFYRLTPGPLPKLEQVAVNLLTHVGHTDRNDINLVPVLGYNKADRFMLGIGFHNYTADVGPTRFHLLPEVSFRDASLNGFAGIKHSIYQRNSWWRELEFSATGRQFHYNYNDTYDYNDRFSRGTIGATLFLKAPLGLTTSSQIGIRGHFIAQRYAVGISAENRTFNKQSRSYSIFEADYNLESVDPIRPYKLTFEAQAGKDFQRVSAVANVAFRYQQAANFIRVRAFVGSFLQRDDPEVAAFLLPNGAAGFLRNQYDYTFQESIINRSSSRDNHQFFVRDGSLSIPYLLTSPFSDSWLASISVVGDAPFSIPIVNIQGYVDAALYPDSRGSASGTVLPVTGGIRLSVLSGAIEVSLPVFNSAFVKEATVFTSTDSRYIDRVAFKLDFSLLDLDNILRNIRG